MKRLFIVVTVVLGVALVAMWMTKPEPKEHYVTVGLMGKVFILVDEELVKRMLKQ